MVPNFVEGLNAALDVTCVNSLQALTVNRAATEPGYALELRHRQKWGKYGEACLAEGVRFCPVVVELHGVYHKEGERIFRRISGALSIHGAYHFQACLDNRVPVITLLILIINFLGSSWSIREQVNWRPSQLAKNVK